MLSPILVENCSDVQTRPCLSDLSRPPWCKEHVYQSLDPMKVLEKELVDFAAWVDLTKEERAIRAIIVKKFDSVIHNIDPTCRAYLCGSTSTHTSVFNSDVDMCVYRFDSNGRKIDVSERSFLSDLTDKIDQYNICDRIEYINAQTPIINGIESEYKLSFDIAFNSEWSLLNTQRVSNALETYPAIFPVLMLMKIILNEKGLLGVRDGGISSTILFHLVLFIVQMSPLEYKNNPAYILMGFLGTYGGTFNFIDNVVSTINGGRVERKSINDPHNLQISVYSTQQQDIVIQKKYTKHRDIIDLFAILKGKLSKPLRQFDSLLERIVDVRDVNIMDKKRKEMIAKFLGKPVEKIERKMQWKELSSFVVAQMTLIKKKKEMPDEDQQNDIYWQNDYIKAKEKVEQPELSVQHTETQPQRTEEKTHQPSDKQRISLMIEKSILKNILL